MTGLLLLWSVCIVGSSALLHEFGHAAYDVGISRDLPCREGTWWDQVRGTGMITSKHLLPPPIAVP